MGRSTFGVWNEDAYQLWLDVSTLTMLMHEMPEDPLRAAKIADGLEAYTRLVDFEQPAARRADYRRAPSLRSSACLSAIRSTGISRASPPPMRCAGHTTLRCTRASARPSKRGVDCGGAMYVEPDTNMPSGEALIRQLVFGKRFFRETFGVESRLLWLPDTFGYSAVLSQLLRGCGAQTAEVEPVAVCGGEAQVMVSAQAQPAKAAVHARETGTGAVLENECVRVEITRQGQIVSYRLNGREMTCGRPMNVLRMYKDLPPAVRCVGYRQQLPGAGKRGQRIGIL